MELNALQKMSSILTPAQMRSSVGILSSSSKVLPSKTTYMLVRSLLHKGKKHGKQNVRLIVL